MMILLVLLFAALATVSIIAGALFFAMRLPGHSILLPSVFGGVGIWLLFYLVIRFSPAAIQWAG